MLLQYSANQWPWQAILNYLKDDYLVCVLITILSFFQSPLEQKKRRTLPCYYTLNLVRFELKIMVKMRYLHQWCIWHLYTFHIYYFYVVVVLQSLSHIQLFATPWTAAHQAPMSTTVSWNLLKFMSIKSVMLSNHIILCLPLLLPPSVFLSARIFSIDSVLRIRWPKYWSFGISLCSEYSGLICFRSDLLDLLAVHGALKSSPTPQFRSIDSLAFSLLHGPTLTSIHDYWKNHSFD